MRSLGKRLTDLEDRFGMSEEAWEQAWGRAMDAALAQVLTPAELAELGRSADSHRTEQQEQALFSALGKWGMLCERIPFRPQGRGR